MTLLATLKSWIDGDGAKYVAVRIPTERSPGAADDPAPLVAGQDYLRVWLQEMYLTSGRKWFTSFHPVVHTLVRLRYGDRTVEVPQVVGELKLDGVNQGNLNSVVNLGVPLTTLLPFHGGTIELAGGLVAVAGNSGITSFVDTLSDFAGLLAVPQLSAGLAIAQPLAKAIENLVISSNQGLHLGVQGAFSAAGGGDAHALRPGYVAVIRSDAKQLDETRLWVNGGRLEYAQDGGARERFSTDDYMLFHFERRSDRDDWEGFASIMGHFNDALSALGDGERERAESLRRVAIAAILTSSDLTAADRRRIAEELQARFQQALDLGLAAVRAEEPLSLAEIVESSRPVVQAAALGEPSFEEIFG